MSPYADDPAVLRRILSQAEALFLDFDGPMCSVFAGLPASVVVDHLCVVLADGGYGDPPPEIEKSSDPFDVLRYAATLGETEARYANAAFSACEAEAIRTAEPTPGADDLLSVWSGLGRPLAIVSNNSTLAVEAYLDLYNLSPYVSYVSARTSPNPGLLKPNPHLLTLATVALDVQCCRSALVGDSTADMEAARATGVPAIGYANKHGKAARLAGAGANYMITRMAELAEAIATS
jgi:HAD superfamily hydrolase (TIGR01549 family)